MRVYMFRWKAPVISFSKILKSIYKFFFHKYPFLQIFLSKCMGCYSRLSLKRIGWAEKFIRYMESSLYRETLTYKGNKKFSKIHSLLKEFVK
jgi:hypothetical protein